MAFNYSRLRGRIVERFGSCKAFADAIGKRQAYVSMIMNGKAVLDSKEIVTWADALGIVPEMYADYFFDVEVNNAQL